MDDSQILKNRVRELRMARNLRQADLAHQVQVTRQTILAIEKDRLNPSIRLSLKIAQVLGSTVDHLFYLESPDRQGRAGGGGDLN
ncbi:MAG: helix-turn-helix transcriptional regulator [Candidatus Hydrogenedentes bacterium]|nr:helix-turn-helix transcriptional regulator [Candidatus Hydrogenedentota bacterium]